MTFDGRQSAVAAELQRGVGRALCALGHAVVAELALSNGRRADVVALSPGGDVWIVEIKSCLLDFQSDGKWPEYRPYCDRLYFAVAPDFPCHVLPEDAGLILADRYGAHLVRGACGGAAERGAAESHDGLFRPRRGAPAAASSRPRLPLQDLTGAVPR